MFYIIFFNGRTGPLSTTVAEGAYHALQLATPQESQPQCDKSYICDRATGDQHQKAD